MQLYVLFMGGISRFQICSGFHIFVFVSYLLLTCYSSFVFYVSWCVFLFGLVVNKTHAQIEIIILFKK